MPVSNPPSMGSIVAEFGGPGNLKAYYRNGPLVPSNQWNMSISTNANSLAVSQFAGARKDVPVTLNDINFTNSWFNIPWNYTSITRTQIVVYPDGHFTYIGPLYSYQGAIVTTGPVNIASVLLSSSTLEYRMAGTSSWIDFISPHTVTGNLVDPTSFSHAYFEADFRVKNNPSQQCHVYIHNRMARAAPPAPGPPGSVPNP